jgi:hypothetical protein
MSRISTPFMPGLEFTKRFVTNTASAIPTLSSYIIGPAAKLVRYDVASERGDGFIGQYFDAADEGVSSYSWPNRPVGGTIDLDYTKVNIDRALLRYFSGSTGFVVLGRNEITKANLTFANDNESLASVAFGDRGVKIGDLVRVVGDAGETEFELNSYVRGYTYTKLSAKVGAAISAPSNAEAVAVPDSATFSSEVTAGESNVGVGFTVVAAADNFAGLRAGVLEDVYTLTCTRASVDGDITTARFRVTSASGTDDLASFQPNATGSFKPLTSRGLLVGFGAVGIDPAVVVGDTFVVEVAAEYTVPTISVQGTYSATDGVDRHYVVEVIQGGLIAGVIRVRVSTIDGNDTVATHTLVVNQSTGVSTPIDLGSYGLTVSFDMVEGLVTGDTWTVTATSAKEGNVKGILLGHNIPASFARDDTDADLTIELFIVDDIELPRKSVIDGQYNYTAKVDSIEIQAGIQLYHPQWTVEGELAPIDLVSGNTLDSVHGLVYITYRAWLPTQTGLQSTTNVDEFDTVVPGAIHPDNPLKYAISKAGLLSSGTPIYYFVVGDPNNIDGWLAALRAADDTRLTYGFVPLTTDPTVIDAVVGHVNTRSGPRYNLYRVLWTTEAPNATQVIVDTSKTSNEDAALATVTNNPDTLQADTTLVTVESDNVSLIELGVRSGDRLRINYTADAWGDETYEEFVIDRLINENTALLVRGPSSPISVAKRFTVVRTLTAADRVEAFGENGTITTASGSTVRRLFFPEVLDGTLKVPSYFMAATLAAARGALAPHEPMTRLTVPGFSGIVGIGDFDAEQLNEIAARGGFIVAPVAGSNTLQVRHAVTAGDFDNVNTREESVWSNIDSINFYLVSVLNPYIGRTNLTDSTIAQIQADLGAANSYLQTANGSSSLGPQVIDLQITTIRPSVVAKDTLVIDMSLLVPGPLNRIQNTIYIS